ncbi:DUF928 domain-containing protein [Leptolyngbya cf. ectocarpi LEGE 11479]|uniref:DUF928 domain-containing protein n=1 Tax=Leptolyngbya cf. ectocarpi LEGE 11479 TaxID=1828722 RepID=A0A928WYI5_LEPEC|nr:DUF928 domain-containing protein [Leptolyngbya ectocarpi]MBE9065662.1 DUF928 domain-containing protein [Leptolyngbya cf. ectocarpi LEGE 11479]
MSRLSYLAQKSLISSVLVSSVAALTTLSVGLPVLALQYNPPNRGAPSNTWNAGSRGGCIDLTAVQPTQTNWGETLMAHPTFGIYVSEPATNLTFELRDERSKEILHRVTFDQIDGPGISLYTLPDTAPALEPDQYYRWRVSLDCAQFNTDKIQYTGGKESGGMIVRRALSDELQTHLETMADAEKPALFATQGLWYDMVHTLLMQPSHQAETEQWTDSWQSLLAHPMVQLHNLMEATLVDCCLAVDCPESGLSETGSSDAALR